MLVQEIFENIVFKDFKNLQQNIIFTAASIFILSIQLSSSQHQC